MRDIMATAPRLLKCKATRKRNLPICRRNRAIIQRVKIPPGKSELPISNSEKLIRRRLCSLSRSAISPAMRGYGWRWPTLSRASPCQRIHHPASILRNGQVLWSISFKVIPPKTRSTLPQRRAMPEPHGAGLRSEFLFGRMAASAWRQAWRKTIASEISQRLPKKFCRMALGSGGIQQCVTAIGRLR